VVTPWRPNLYFDFSKVRLLLSYGVGFIGGDILNILLLNLDYLLVGRYLGSEDLGVYTLSFRLPDLLIMQFARILSWVIFPIYTRMKEEPGGLARGFAVTTRYVSLLTVPLGIGLALIAQPFTLVVFSDKWIEAIPVIRTLALYAMFLSIAHNISSAYRASGRLNVVTWMGGFRLVLLFPALWWATTVASSIVAVGWMQATVACISTIANLLLAARLLGLPLKELFASLRPAIMAGSVMLIVVVFVLNMSQMSKPWLQMTVSVVSGGISYIALLWFVQRQTVLDAVRKLRTAINRNS
jgi:PST family polysaccharide transporter